MCQSVESRGVSFVTGRGPVHHDLFYCIQSPKVVVFRSCADGRGRSVKAWRLPLQLVSGNSLHIFLRAAVRQLRDALAVIGSIVAFDRRYFLSQQRELLLGT